MDAYDKLVHVALWAQWDAISTAITCTANKKEMFLEKLRDMQAETLKMINLMEGM